MTAKAPMRLHFDMLLKYDAITPELQKEAALMISAITCMETVNLYSTNSYVPLA